MGVSLGLVGLGAFGSSFAPLFNSHPLVDRIALCDREPERIEEFAEKDSFQEKFSPDDTYESLDDILGADLDALVIITQPWLHAPQCIEAMDHGKHVYSAVPVISIPDADEILDWCERIVQTCERTGRYYMLGETTYYHADAMFCRRKAEEGAFGNFVYAEGEYFHDVDARCNLREVQKHRTSSASGREWLEILEKYRKQGAKSGPMHYPTHSVSGPICVMNTHAEEVTCYGYENQNDDPYFKDAAYSNEMALFRLANGATLRICECREIARAGEETFRLYGTRGSYRDGIWETNGRDEPLSAVPLETEQLTQERMRTPLPAEVLEAFASASPENPYGGHGGSHSYLVHEFVSAVAEDRQPAINAWEAVRYMAMGATAHKSALAGGKTLEVPDWGEPPGL